jgi:hypothetical protein
LATGEIDIRRIKTFFRMFQASQHYKEFIRDNSQNLNKNNKKPKIELFSDYLKAIDKSKANTWAMNQDQIAILNKLFNCLSGDMT